MTANGKLNGSGHAAAESAAAAVPVLSRPSLIRSVSAWLGGNRLGLAVIALIVGAGAGLGAAVFRELIYAVTWLATGYTRFGQQGHAASLHLPALGILFVLVIPVVGGLLYGPLIQRFAKEARGHGVPEVMLAVAENGGRIRPQVSIVKALASAICIGTGGSVGTRRADRPDRSGVRFDARAARADVRESVADHRRVRRRGRDRRYVQRAGHGAVLRV